MKKAEAPSVRWILGISLLLCLASAIPSLAESAAETAADAIPCSEAGPQTPRDIADLIEGVNPVRFPMAPGSAEMNLCNIHFHKFAEHRGPDYTNLGEGAGGFVCKQAKPSGHMAADSHEGACKGVAPGDTIEVHWVFTTCDVPGGPGLGSCLSDTCKDPKLRVEAQVFNLAKDGANFAEHQATSPAGGGTVQFLGSTTGPKYNSTNACSPFQVTWDVARSCLPLDIDSLHAWCEDNLFEENHAHGVRELVTSPALLSAISAGR